MTHQYDPQASPASVAALALLAQLHAQGLRDVVVSPGSRSQALALAAAQLADEGLLRLSVRMDERVAGFLALGLAVGTERPVAVVTTSGTAVANLHPAVLEARHAGVPLLLLTADRPDEARGIGGNQTTIQPGLFAPAVLAEWDVPAPTADADLAPLRALAAEAHATASRGPGPVQLNLAYREPLSSAGLRTPAAEPIDVPQPEPDPAFVRLAPEEGTVVIAGADAGPRAEELAHELAAPLLAEISSGARFGPNLVGAYRQLLSDAEFGGRVRRAIVLGHPTLSREVPTLLARDDVDVIVERGRAGEDFRPSPHAVVVDEVRVLEAAPEPWMRSWPGRWARASRALLEREVAAPDLAAARSLDKEVRSRFAREELAIARRPVDRRSLVESVWAATWPHDRLVLGASRLIRVADGVVPGKKLVVHANRGLAGIDGTIATAIGIATAQQADAGPGVTRVLLGDLALLHDAGALLLPPGEPRPRIQVIVGDDRGGTIFDGLEVAASAPAEAFERVLRTPHEVDLAALATAYGWKHVRVAHQRDLDTALTDIAGPLLIEVPLPR